MARDRELITRVLKFSLIFENAVFLFMGLALTIFGIYLMAVGQNLNFITDNVHFSGSVLVLVIGLVSVLFAGLGIAGAVLESLPLLGTYIVCISAMVISEVVTSIIVFANLSEITSRANSEMLGDIQNYALPTNENYDAGINQFVDSVQNLFDCCGVNGPEDWLFYNLPYCIANEGLPKSCQCSNADSDSCFIFHFSGYTFSSWTEGCNQTFSDFVDQNSSAVGVTVFLLALAEVVALVISCLLFCLHLSNPRSKVRYKILGGNRDMAYGAN